MGMTEHAAPQLRKRADPANKQNRSDAVMAQRGASSDSADDFPTPPWATRALFKHVIGRSIWGERTAWEPCANRGYMAEVLKEEFGDVLATDLFDYGYCPSGVDFLSDEFGERGIDWVIANPPFVLGSQFALRGLAVARIGVALLVRTAFLEGGDRFATLFSARPPQTVAQFVERVPMVEGVYDPGASTATAYAWLTWNLTHESETRFMWIPPCRAELERPVERVVGLIDAAEHYRKKWIAFDMGFEDGDAADMRKKFLARQSAAQRAFAKLSESDQKAVPNVGNLQHASEANACNRQSVPS
jgi:hypothetical protein